jgi:hypothetical protein
MRSFDRIRLGNPQRLTRSAAVLLFLVLQSYLFFVRTHDTLDLDIAPNTRPGPLIWGETTVGQTFVAESDGLGRVDIMMGTLGRPNDRNLYFRLYRLGERVENIRTVAVNAAGLLNNLYNRFVFKPVAGSGKQAFSFILTSPGSWPDNSVCAWMNGRNIYRQGSALIDGAPAHGDLVFRVYSRRPLFTEIRRIVRKNPGILGRTWFFVLGAVAFEVVFLLVVVRLVDVLFYSRRKRIEGAEPLQVK